MFCAGQRDMQQMDQYTMDRLGLPGVVLMENAGARVVEEIIQHSPGEQRKVVILIGGGNNGGDGFVIGRRLRDIDWEPQVWLLTDPRKLKGDAKVHYDVYVNRGLPMLILAENQFEQLKESLDWADVIVDAILGTGVKGAVREPFKQVISAVNQYENRKMVIAVDIPSGVDSDTGKVEGAAIQATKTVSFVFPKKGFFLQDGPRYIGEWKAVDISVPPSIVYDLDLELPQLITPALVQNLIPKRPSNGHKGTFGHVLVVGGSRSYVGAPIFTAKAALGSGAGLVTMAVPESIYPMAASQAAEALFLPLSEKDGHFSGRALKQLIPELAKFSVVAVGPGLSRFEGGEDWMKQLMACLQGQPLVVDADGLYLLRRQLKEMSAYKGPVIFTPHPGEMAQLTGKTVREIEENRLETARSFAADHGVFLLLKGHRSVIAAPNGELYINPCGHDALGKGGSGDVLTGVIAAFLAQGTLPLHSLIAASFLHAKAGDHSAEFHSRYGVMPSDIIMSVKKLLAL